MRAGTCDLTQKLLPFNFVIATNNNNRLPRTPSFFLQPYRRMAAEGARATITPASHPIQPESEAEAAERKHDPPENSRKEIPPPPEKPEPGDCCGSGCVRCIWDVYYEELEEYNKLYKQDPNPKS